MSYRLFIDDERFPPDDGQEWKIARSMAETQAIIAEHGCPQFISFDHDLGDDVPTGKDIANWLLNQDMDAVDRGEDFFPVGFWFTVHSQNPVGAQNITLMLKPYLSWDLRE